MNDVLLSAHEVCAALNCSKPTLWRWAANGTIRKPLKIGGMSRWKASYIEQMIAEADAKAGGEEAA